MYMYMNIYKCITCIHVYECKDRYVHCIYTFIIVNMCMSIVQTHLSMYQYELPCTCTIQGGTRWYKVVQDGIRRYKQWYMEVHGL